MKRVRGFTLIEMVIALAIAAMLVAAVWTTTQSMAAVAKRQQDAGVASAHMDRFLAVLRRDLQARMVASSTTDQQVTGIGDADLLSFDTLADSLVDISAGMDGGSVPHRRASVRYTVHAGPGYCEIERVEVQRGVGSTNVRLLRCSDAPSIDFYEGGKWTHAHALTKDTKAVSLRFGGETFVIGL